MIWIFLRMRVRTAWAAAVVAWRGYQGYPVKRPRKRRRLGVVVGRPLRWLYDHLAQLVALALMLALLVRFGAVYLARWNDENLDAHSLKDLVLLGLVVGLAVLAQLGHRLLHRLKKVGPVEFIEQRYDQIAPELPDVVVELDGPRPPLPAKLLWEYEKAEVYVTHIEWSDLEVSAVIRKERFHDLLFKMGAISLMCDYLARAVDRLELLLKISAGEYKCAETHYRCGIAYRMLGSKEEAKEMQARKNGDRKNEDWHRQEKMELYRKAQDYLRKAGEEDPYHYQAYVNLAYVQALLKEYSLAIENNEAAIKIFPGFAPAEYNRAICYLKLDQEEKALKAIESIKKDDEGAREVLITAFRDVDLLPLLFDPHHGEDAWKHLEMLSSTLSPG